MRQRLARTTPFFSGALLGLVWWAYMFAGFKYFEQFDWQQHLSFREIQRKILFEHHQFPMWNPWLCGGEPLGGHPHFDFPYPSTFLTGLLGTFYGTLALVLLSVILFLWGAERLVRHLGVRDPWLVWAITSEGVHIFIIYVWGGALEYLTIAWVPWFWLLFFRSIDAADGPAFRALLLGSGALAMVVIGSAPYIGAGTAVLVLVVAALEAVRRSTLLPLLRVVQMGAITVSLTALKWVPMVSLLARVRRTTVVNPDVHIIEPSNLTPFGRSLQDIFFTGGPVRVDVDLIRQYGSFVITYQLSPAILLLAVVGMSITWRRGWPLGVASLLLLCLLPADASVLNLWNLLHQVFPFSDLEFPIKFIGLFILQIMMLAALGAARLESFLKHTRRVRVFALAIALTSAFYIVDRSDAVKEQFTLVNAPLSLPTAPFAQVGGDSDHQYKNVLQNNGTLKCYDSLGSQIGTAAAGREETAAYHGEAYWADGNTSVNSLTTPNEIRLSTEGRTGTIVVNQNYFPGWQARGSDGREQEVVDDERLLTVKVTTQAKWVTLRYRPTSVALGWIMSFGGVLIFGLLWSWTKRPRNDEKRFLPPRGA